MFLHNLFNQNKLTVVDSAYGQELGAFYALEVKGCCWLFKKKISLFKRSQSLILLLL